MASIPSKITLSFHFIIATLLQATCSHAQLVSDYSFMGLVEHRDSDGRYYTYYEPSDVPGMISTKFLLLTHYRQDPRSAGIKEPRVEIGYIINCETSVITQVFNLYYVAPTSIDNLSARIRLG
jgi:hypothetical protein